MKKELISIDKNNVPDYIRLDVICYLNDIELRIFHLAFEEIKAKYENVRYLNISEEDKQLRFI